MSASCNPSKKIAHGLPQLQLKIGRDYSLIRMKPSLAERYRVPP